MTETLPEITEDVRKYAAEQAISEEEAPKKVMEEPSAAKSKVEGVRREGRGGLREGVTATGSHHFSFG